MEVTTLESHLKKEGLTMTTREYFIERYGDQYLDKIKHLKDLIIELETGKHHFTAVGYEAGIGKSIETDRIVTEYVNKHGDFGRKFLLVKRFVADINQSINYMNKNSTLDGPIALGISHDNWKELQLNLEQIQMYPVIIITHSRYFTLSQEPHFRQYFERERHTLIIDEQLELPIYSFSEQLYQEMNGALPSHTIVPKLQAVCQGLFTEITRLRHVKANNHILKANPLVNIRLVEEFEDDYRANFYQFRNESARSKLENFIKFLYSLESNVCLYNNGRLSTYNKFTYRWKLSNNLLLDANAGIDRRYKYASDFAVDCPDKIIDHSGTTFYPVVFNTSKSNIHKVKNNYYDKVCELIKQRHDQNDKTLIVTHYQHEKDLINSLRNHGIDQIGVGDRYKNGDIAIAHFGAINGQNHWRNFNKVWVIASPNLPMDIYPLQWAFFKQSPIRNHSLQMIAAPGKYTFKNRAFEDIRHGCQVSEIYQAIKRINREGHLTSEIYVVNKNKDILNEVIEQLKDVKVGEAIVLDVERPKDEKTAPAKENKTVQFAKFIKRLSPGKYKKKEIYDMLDWKSDGHLSGYLKDKDIREMRQAGLIDWDHFSITILPGPTIK